MGQYLLIETHDPFTAADGGGTFELGRRLAEEHDVVIFMLQNAVLATRKASSAAAALTPLRGRATLLADEFSLRERGIRDDELAEGVRRASIDELVDLVVDDGRKAIWH